jgi:hypothetical protein
MCAINQMVTFLDARVMLHHHASSSSSSSSM